MKEGIELADYKGRGRERDGGWFREIKSCLSGQIDSLITSVSHKWMRDRNAGAGRKINSVILFPLPFYRCRNKILLLWDSSFGSFSPPLMHSNSLLSFLFSPLGLTLLFHWCAVAHSLSTLLLAGILMRLLCYRYSASSALRLSHTTTTTTTTLGRFYWTVVALLDAVH